jgi:VWFA-related protein
MRFILPMLLIAALLLTGGCNRVKNPLMTVPAASTTQVIMQVPEIDNSGFPSCRAYVLVTDQGGTALTAFNIGNFTVLEDGKPTVVTAAAKAIDPLSVVLCLDRSGSMADEIFLKPTTDTNNAAMQFVDALGANDSVELIDFATTAEIKLPFTSDKSLLKQAILAGEANGSTALYDAMGLGLDQLKKRSGRKFIFVLTDGLENASEVYKTETEIAQAIQTGGMAAYIIGLGGSVDTASLQYIAATTGGRFFNSPTSSVLSTYFEQVLYLMNNLVQVDFRSRTSGMKEAAIYINYGTFTTNAKRTYGY